MLSNYSLFESWAKFSRTLYVHKLEKPKGDHTIDSLEKLKDIGIINNINNVYIYSFIHTDGNDVYSFTAGQPLKKNMDKKTWLSYINPLRGMLYKGGGQGGGDKFSSERIAKDFQTNAFLFTGEKNKFKKVDEIHTEAISTTVPIPFPFGAIVVIYENIRMDCKKNQQNIETIQFKRIKGFTAPQLVLKSNYVYVFKCKTS